MRGALSSGGRSSGVDVRVKQGALGRVHFFLAPGVPQGLGEEDRDFVFGMADWAGVELVERRLEGAKRFVELALPIVREA